MIETNPPLNSAPDWLPVGYDKDSDRLCWKKLPECTFNEAFFDWCIESHEDRHGPAQELVTSISDLACIDFFSASPPPTALIFHMSRCGSTLLSKALSRAPGIHIVSESRAINGVLYPRFAAASSGESPQPFILPTDRLILHNTVQALCRPRYNGTGPAFFKLSSWNVLFLNVFRAIFPDTPRLFVYREPGAIMASQFASPAGFAKLGEDEFSCFLSGLTPDEINAGGPTVYIASCLSRMMQVALADSDIHYLDHSALTPSALPGILNALGLNPDPAIITAMRPVFDHYSKSPGEGPIYVDDTAAKAAALDIHTRELVAARLAPDYARLAASPRNLRCEQGVGSQILT